MALWSALLDIVYKVNPLPTIGNETEKPVQSINTYSIKPPI